MTDEVTVRAGANVLGLTPGATVTVERTPVVANHIAAGLLTEVEPPQGDAGEPNADDAADDTQQGQNGHREGDSGS